MDVRAARWKLYAKLKTLKKSDENYGIPGISNRIQSNKTVWVSLAINYGFSDRGEDTAGNIWM